MRARTDYRRIFLALAKRNYRLHFIGQLISVADTWMQSVALAFLVLKLTGSGAALGVSTAVRFLPIALLTPPGESEMPVATVYRAVATT